MLGTRTSGACYGHIFIKFGVTGRRPAPTLHWCRVGKEGNNGLIGRFLFAKVVDSRYVYSICLDEPAMEKCDIGQVGEDAAAEYLVAHGYRIRERNYANTRGLRVGEIDIVAEKGKEIVFVEVKSAFIPTGREERLPEWQVSRAKLRKLERAASVYLKEFRLEERSYSFDVVAVTFTSTRDPIIRHLDHVFLS